MGLEAHRFYPILKHIRMNTETVQHTNWQKWIGEIDFKSTGTRRQHVLTWLHNARIPYFLQPYASGVNIYVKLGKGPRYFAVSCHLDRVKGAGGANDNGAAIATCLELTQQYLLQPFEQSLLVLFFDEEETGLKGSRAYIEEFGFEDIHTLVNLELVGFGDCGILWPADSHPNSITQQLITVTETRQPKTDQPFFAHPLVAMPNFPLYFSDADSFIEAGCKNTITLTRITERDYNLTGEYIRLQKEGVDGDELDSLITGSDTLKYYHTPQDVSSNIENKAIHNNIDLLKEIIKHK